MSGDVADLQVGQRSDRCFVSNKKDMIARTGYLIPSRATHYLDVVIVPSNKFHQISLPQEVLIPPSCFFKQFSPTI